MQVGRCNPVIREEFLRVNKTFGLAQIGFAGRARHVGHQTVDVDCAPLVRVDGTPQKFVEVGTANAVTPQPGVDLEVDGRTTRLGHPRELTERRHPDGNVRPNRRGEIGVHGVEPGENRHTKTGISKR